MNMRVKYTTTDKKIQRRTIRANKNVSNRSQLLDSTVLHNVFGSAALQAKLNKGRGLW
jgi:hypothetical protein